MTNFTHFNGSSVGCTYSGVLCKRGGNVRGELIFVSFFLKLQLFEGWWGQLKLLVSVLNSQSELD